MARMVRSSAVAALLGFLPAVVAETKKNAFTRWGDVLANRHRLVLNLAHISNATIHDKNAGEEEFYITYAIPF